MTASAPSRGQGNTRNGSPTPAASDRHILGLDLLRFFAAAMVMLFHLAYLDWALPGSTAHRLSGGVYSFPELGGIASFGWLGVQIFFVISGVVIAYSAEHAGLFSFVRSRALRLLPAAWICATLSFIVLSLMAGSMASMASTAGAAGGVDFRSYERSLLLWPFGPWIDPSYWTLGVEICFYALVALIVAMRRGAFHVAVFRLALALGVVSTAWWLAWWLSFADAGGGLHQWLLRHRESRLLELLLVPHGCFFALGVVLWSQLLKRDTWAGRVALSFLLLPCLLQIAAHHALADEKTGIATPLWPPLLMWLAAVAWIALSIGFNARIVAGERWRGLLRRMGLMTYPLYLIHQVVGCLLLGALAAAGIERHLALGIAIALLLALSNLICSLLEPPLRTTLKYGFALFQRHAYS